MNAQTTPIHGTEVEGAKKVKLKQYQAQLFFEKKVKLKQYQVPRRLTSQRSSALVVLRHGVHLCGRGGAHATYTCTATPQRGACVVQTEWTLA